VENYTEKMLDEMGIARSRRWYFRRGEEYEKIVKYCMENAERFMNEEKEILDKKYPDNEDNSKSFPSCHMQSVVEKIAMNIRPIWREISQSQASRIPLLDGERFVISPTSGITLLVILYKKIKVGKHQEVVYLDNM
jgi:hypothetical protein